MASRKKIVLAVGELLWDLLPGGKQPGGAAANFVYHAGVLGAEGRLVSRVGDDPLGRELLERLGALGIATDGIAIDPGLPTGTVQVELDAARQPVFTIRENVAWDHIRANQGALRAAATADAICFGTLAQRGAISRAAIRDLLAAARPEALKIYDVNLRQDFYSREIVEDSLRRANVLKLNHQELPLLAGMFALQGDPARQLAELAARYDLQLVALTRGAHGSLLYAGGSYAEHPGLPGPVADTVGAGDSFTAALALGWLAGRSLDAISRGANEVAAYVVSQPGATPRLPDSLISRFLQPPNSSQPESPQEIDMNRKTIACASLLLTFTLARGADDRVIADFEAGDYGAWTATGTAFGSGPAQGTQPGQQKVDGFAGHGLANSFHNGDGATGTLTSPPFKIERRFINFLIGGGGFAGKTCMNLQVDGRVVRTATGPNTAPGGAESLEPGSWDVAEFAGKEGVLEIVDQVTGPWGHILIDQIIASDAPAALLLRNPTRQITITQPYLRLPIKNDGVVRHLTLLADGKAAEPVMTVPLADGAPDWWAWKDVTAYKGREITLQVDRLSADSSALKQIEQAAQIPTPSDLYHEPLRPQFHFSSRQGWLNDPNGLAFYRGEYHLFYQHNPYGWGWGNMHWGHAVSRDLVHWKELGDVLAPDDLGAMFSGSAVVDWKNTSGLGKDGQPPLVLIYTAHAPLTTQCLAYSLDGRTFTKYSGNPVIPQITEGNRDPKVIWHEPTHRWVMALYVHLPSVEKDESGHAKPNHTIHFLSSPDLKNWTVLSHVPFSPECPDFFELPVDGDPGKMKWVLSSADSDYQVGSFDGTTFTPETPILPGHPGKTGYAAQTYSDLPAQDGRRIQIAWLQAPSPGMPFNQEMSLPIELKLVSTPDGPRLTHTPVEELKALRGKAQRFGPLALKPGDLNPLADLRGDGLEIHAQFSPGDAKEVAFDVRGASVLYDAAAQEIVVNGVRVKAPLRGGSQQLAIYLDRTSIEVFADGGLAYVLQPFIPKAGDESVKIGVPDGTAKIESLEAYPLKSAWE